MKIKTLSHSQIENIMKDLNAPAIIGDWLPASEKKQYDELCGRIAKRNEIAEKAKEIHDTMIMQGLIASGRYTPGFQTGRGTDLYNFVPDEPIPQASPNFPSEQRTRRLELGKLLEQICRDTISLKPEVDAATERLRPLAQKENARLTAKYEAVRGDMIKSLGKLGFPSDIADLFADHSATVKQAAGSLQSEMGSAGYFFLGNRLPAGGENIACLLQVDRLFRPPQAGTWRKAAELARELIEQSQEDEA
jgi:hypothetical protein